MPDGGQKHRIDFRSKFGNIIYSVVGVCFDDRDDCIQGGEDCYFATKKID